jgi:YD repeat-containing protein
MWSDREPDPQPDLRLQNVPIAPSHGISRVWSELASLVSKHLFFLAVAIGVSFALIYAQMTTRLFFSLDAPRQVGDPCLTLIRPTTGSEIGTVWTNFGHCPATSRDPERETFLVDLRYGLLVYHKTEPVMMGALPLPFTRVLRHRDRFSRAFGTGGTHTYDMGLVGDAPRLTFVDLVLAGGGRVHYRPTAEPGLYDSDVDGYFGNTTLQWTGREWRLRRDDGVELLFPESQNATRLEQAALVGMQMTNGQPVVDINRDRAGNLRRLSASRRRLDFEYDTLNRVTAIVDAETGRHLRFDYNSDGCLVRQTGSGGVFQYDHDRRNGACQLRRTVQDGVTYFQADYNADDRVIRLTNPAGGSYTFSYETDTRGNVVRAEVREPEGILRRVTLDDAGYWFSRWGSYRGH